MSHHDTEIIFYYIGRLIDKGKMPYIRGYFYTHGRQYMMFYGNNKNDTHTIPTPSRIPGMSDRQFKKYIKEKVEDINTLFHIYML